MDWGKTLCRDEVPSSKNEPNDTSSEFSVRFPHCGWPPRATFTKRLRNAVGT
jgi:hypothetical protein